MQHGGGRARSPSVLRAGKPPLRSAPLEARSTRRRASPRPIDWPDGPHGIPITVYLETGPDGYVSMMIPPTVGMFRIRPGAANHLMLSAEELGNEHSQAPAAE